MTNQVAYVTLQGDDKLLHFSMDVETGVLEQKSEISISGGPAPLAVSPDQQKLYVGLRASHEIASFEIDQATGALTHLKTIALDDNPCCIAVDKTGRHLLATYYGGGKVTVNVIDSDGTVSNHQTQAVETATHAHYIELDDRNQVAFVPHTEPANVIFQFKFDENTGQLNPNTPAQLQADPGRGPRHYVYHPTQRWVYTSDENGSSVTAYEFDHTSGTLTAFQTESTLPTDFSDENTCAQIHIHPNGQFLYVSNRGHDSIACFTIDGSTGQLTSTGQQPTEPVPRVFNLDFTGNFLYAAGQGSGQLASYRINQTTGSLHPFKTYELGEQPMWVMFLRLT
ncbi:MAG: beta-propeller fold lactonase family protein [Chloroflexota bacterium]